MTLFPRNASPSASRVGMIRQHLARLKVDPIVANELVKMSRTNDGNSERIRAWAATLPKKP